MQILHREETQQVKKVLYSTFFLFNSKNVLTNENSGVILDSSDISTLV